MSKRWSLNFWNDWRYVGRGVVDVTVLRVNTDYQRGQYFCADVVILGFGFSVMRLVDPAKWGIPVESLGRAE